jgi:hypothetical protein
MQEQLWPHSAAHSSEVLFATSANPSGGFIPGKVKKPSPVPHRSRAFFRLQPSENLPISHSSVFTGLKPSRHLHVSEGFAVSSQYPLGPQ